MTGHAVIIAAILSAVSASSANVNTPAEKCQPDDRDASALFPDAPDVVRVLNGKVIENAELANLTPDTVESIFVVCDAIDVYEEFGIKSKRGGVFIFTKPGPKTMLKTSLDSVATLQQTYRATLGRFATRLADLAWSDPSGLIAVDLKVTESGDRWTATGSHRYLMFFHGPNSVMTVSGSTQVRSALVEGAGAQQ